MAEHHPLAARWTVLLHCCPYLILSCMVVINVCNKLFLYKTRF